MDFEKKRLSCLEWFYSSYPICTLCSHYPIKSCQQQTCTHSFPLVYSTICFHYRLLGWRWQTARQAVAMAQFLCLLTLFLITFRSIYCSGVKTAFMALHGFTSHERLASWHVGCSRHNILTGRKKSPKKLNCMDKIHNQEWFLLSH